MHIQSLALFVSLKFSCCWCLFIVRVKHCFFAEKYYWSSAEKQGYCHQFPSLHICIKALTLKPLKMLVHWPEKMVCYVNSVVHPFKKIHEDDWLGQEEVKLRKRLNSTIILGLGWHGVIVTSVLFMTFLLVWLELCRFGDRPWGDGLLQGLVARAHFFSSCSGACRQPVGIWFLGWGHFFLVSIKCENF